MYLVFSLVDGNPEGRKLNRAIYRSNVTYLKLKETSINRTHNAPSSSVPPSSHAKGSHFSYL